MLDGVTPIYSNDNYSLSIFEANGSVMDMLVNFTESLTTELFPQNGTWSLVYWEDKLGIVHKEKRLMLNVSREYYMSSISILLSQEKG